MNNINKPEESLAVKPVLVSRDYLVMAILLMVIVFLWIGYGVYKNLTETAVPEPVRGLTKPIKVGFPQEVLENLKQRKNYREMDLNEGDRVILKEGGTVGIQTSL